MGRAEQKNTLAESLEIIQTQLAELRQTESLEFQVHEMVLVKRYRLDALMADYVALARTAFTNAEEPIIPEILLPEVAMEEMSMAPLAAMDAPRDLLRVPPTPLTPLTLSTLSTPSTPSAQQVLDSLNRLMSGMKGISAKQVAA